MIVIFIVHTNSEKKMWYICISRWFCQINKAHRTIHSNNPSKTTLVKNEELIQLKSLHNGFRLIQKIHFCLHFFHKKFISKCFEKNAVKMQLKFRPFRMVTKIWWNLQHNLKRHIKWKISSNFAAFPKNPELYWLIQQLRGPNITQIWPLRD